MKLDIYIIDDEEFSARYLSNLVQNTPGLNLLGYETNPLIAKERLLNKEIRPDVILLDIEMPGLNGIQFAEQVNKLTSIVFITAMDQYPLQAFSVGAHDYLLKPLDLEKFQKSMERMRERLSKGNITTSTGSKKLEFKFGLNHESRFIDPEEIVYVEASSNYALVNSSAGQLVRVIKTMDEMKILLGASFMKVHRSFIVRMDKVIGMEGNDIRMVGNFIIPLGRSFKDEFREKLNNYIK